VLLGRESSECAVLLGRESSECAVLHSLCKRVIQTPTVCVP
jgi:hypothetical protein